MHPRFTRQSIFVTSAVYISVCFPSPAAFLSLSASMPARRRPCRVLVDRNWGAKFSKSGSEVFMKVYSPSASHSSSSSYPPRAPCFVRSSFFFPRPFFIPPFSARSCFLLLSDVRSLSLSLSLLLFCLAGALPPYSPSARIAEEPERVNPRSPSAELEQKPGELHLFLSYGLTLSFAAKLIVLSIAPNLYPISRLAVAVSSMIEKSTRSQRSTAVSVVLAGLSSTGGWWEERLCLEARTIGRCIAEDEEG